MDFFVSPKDEIWFLRVCHLPLHFNWPLRIKIRVATFHASHSVTDSPQTINQSINQYINPSIAAPLQQLPDSAVQSVSTAGHSM